MKRQTIRPVGPQLRRRDVLALAAAAGFAPVFAGRPALASNGPQHGIAMHGSPALPPDFAALPYANPAAPKGGRLAMGFQGTFDSLNPFNLKAGSTAQGLNTNVFQTLMTRSTDEPFTLYGLIAETIETDADRSFATFRINPRARFSDGQPITSADLAFSFDLLKRKGRPQHRGAFSLVKSVDVPDERTIRYDLTGIGDRELPLTLALMPVLAKHKTDADRFDDANLDIPTGSGPYRIDQLRPGELLLLKRNPDYWANDLPIHRGLFNFDEIRVEYFRDGTTFYEAAKAGILDYREETNPTRWISGYDFPAINSGQIKKAALPLGGAKGMIGFAFNTRRELFGDVRVREALGYMFDFEWINANLFGDLYRRTKSFFDESELSSSGIAASPEERALLAQWPGCVRDDILEGRWTPPRSDGSGRDRANARKALDLFAQAGWRIQDGALKRAGRSFIFEIMVTDRNQERLSLNFAQSLQRIGVDTHVRYVDEVQYQRRRQKFDFDMMIGTWTASNSPGNEQRNRWSSASAKMESSFNLAGAAQPALDELISKILSAKSKTDFVTTVRAFDRVLLSGFYIIPLYHSPNQWIVHARDIAYPERLPKFASPLFGATLDSWWRPGA